MEIIRAPLYQQSYDIILERIKDGRFSPGQVVDAQTLADALGISRTPVREAIRRLIEEGLLESHGNLRARVYLPNVTDLAEIYQVRASMYSIAAQTVAQFRDDLDLTYLRSSVPRAENDLEPGHVADANDRFHREVVKLSGNRTILKFQETMSLKVRQYRHLAMQYPERRSGSLDEHARILAFIEAGDAEAARRETYTHILRAGAWAIDHLSPDTKTDTLPMKFLRSQTESPLNPVATAAPYPSM